MKLLGRKRQIATWPKARGRITSLNVETRDYSFIGIAAAAMASLWS